MSFDPRGIFSRTFTRVARHRQSLGMGGPLSDLKTRAAKFQIGSAGELPSLLHQAIVRTRNWLTDHQHALGYWVGELEGDSILESEFILLLAWLARENEPIAVKCARHLLDLQLPDGGWAIYPGGPVDTSASVKAYFALKLTGHKPASEPMRRARSAILANGGADAVNSFTRFYLALLGQIAYDQCPVVPPEFVLLPKWFLINLYAVSAWSRTIIVPLSIMSAHRPVRQIDPARGIRELFIRAPADWPPLRCPGLKGGTGLLSWDRFFRTVDKCLKFLERNDCMPCRERAIRAAARWMIERFEGSDGLGAIFPPMVWSVIALRCLGYPDDSREIRYCLERLEGLVIENEQSARLQPCKSPVWDTAIAIRSLNSAGVSNEHSSIERGIDWLLDNEIRCAGDWSETVDCEPGGWCFEHANQFYPDLDDTAMVAMALASQFQDRDLSATSASSPLPCATAVSAARGPASRSHGQDGRGTDAEEVDVRRLDRILAATARAEKWMLAMQNGDGGWAAFDRDNDRQFLCYVPFADHNAMIDPSTPDLTARVLEALGHLGRRKGHRVVDRAIAYLRETQEPDGSWFGRWGVNYVYGTWQALAGLAAVGMPANDPMMIAGANWLCSCQQPGGGWGESPDSYAEPHKRGQGKVTASQTAWALLGLMAAGQANESSVRRGIAYLIDEQQSDGSWNETEFTGTGFPRVFYLRYHMYPIYFPLMALSQFARQSSTSDKHLAVD